MSLNVNDKMNNFLWIKRAYWKSIKISLDYFFCCCRSSTTNVLRLHYTEGCFKRYFHNKLFRFCTLNSMTFILLVEIYIFFTCKAFVYFELSEKRIVRTFSRKINGTYLLIIENWPHSLYIKKKKHNHKFVGLYFIFKPFLKCCLYCY